MEYAFSGNEKRMRQRNKLWRLTAAILAAAASIANSGCSSEPSGIDVKPVTSLRLNTGADFFDKIHAQLSGPVYDYSKNGIGYIVYRIAPQTLDSPNIEVFRDINVYRTSTPEQAQEIYAKHRLDFASHDWKLYREQGDGTEKWFIGYKGTRFDTNHGIPLGLNTKPEILIGVLKQNLFIVISHTAYSRDAEYVQTINGDIRFTANLLSKSATPKN
jgi:hypothetical protein